MTASTCESDTALTSTIRTPDESGPIIGMNSKRPPRAASSTAYGTPMMAKKMRTP